MSSNETIDGSAIGNPDHLANTVAEGKGKGKAVENEPKDVEMEEDDDDDDEDEETGAEDEKRKNPSPSWHKASVFCMRESSLLVVFYLAGTALLHA